MKVLASNCIFVEGAKMNLVIDVQNRCWYHIDKSLNDLLLDQVDDEMSQFLKDNGIVLEVPEFLKDQLPKMSTQYRSPQKREAIIIDFNEESNHTIASVLELMDGFNPIHLQIRYFTHPIMCDLFEGLEYLDETTIEAVELLLPFDRDVHALLIQDDFIDMTSKLYRVLFHSVSESFDKAKFEHRKFYFSTEKITNHSMCGFISPHNFSNNPKHTFKSMNFNSCLYKKIGIDVNGNIKNCPSLNSSIGNVKNTSFETIEHAQFSTELMTKDEIEVCKDCEFRYVCTDCRAYTDSTIRRNARPLKCGYNPYIAKWSHETGYKTLADTGVVSNEHDFSIDSSQF